jgi:hypothetical protein
MQRLLILFLMALGIVLSACSHYIKIAPGAPHPRIALHPARTADRQYVPKLAHYFQAAGYRVVYGRPSEYNLNFSVSDQRVFVDVTMVLFEPGDHSSAGEARVFANARFANQAAVVDAAIDEALDDLEAPSVRVISTSR